jgi:hypothetical protein
MNLFTTWKMTSSGMFCRVVLVRTDVSKESSASIIRVRRISELGRNVGSYKSHTTCHLKRRRWLGSMVSSEMLRRVTLVKTDVSEELSASIIRVTRIGKLGTMLAVTSNRGTLRRNTLFVACVSWLLQLTLFLVHRFLSPWWWRR